MPIRILILPDAGGSSTYSYSGSGSLAFSGVATSAKTKSYPGNGSFTFSGAASVDKIKSFLAGGNIVFSGAATTSYTPSGAVIYGYVGGGEIVLSGSASITKSKNYSGTGSYSFSGAATTSYTSGVAPTLTLTNADLAAIDALIAARIPTVSEIAAAIWADSKALTVPKFIALK